MTYTSVSIEKAVEILSSLPTIGRKTAQRLAFYILRQNGDYAEKLTQAILDLKKNVKYCSICFNYTDIDPCPVCSSQKRDRSIICVVEEPNDVVAIEKTGEYKGLYHVLHGCLNPLDGISPEDIKIKELLSRIYGINELIIALNSSVEGEVTTQYIAKILKPFDIKITRIARGIPIGTDLEFTDEATLARALEGRVAI